LSEFIYQHKIILNPSTISWKIPFSEKSQSSYLHLSVLNNSSNMVDITCKE